MRVVAHLLLHHLRKNHKILVLCNNLFALERYETMLSVKRMDGETDSETRRALLKRFQESKGGDFLLVSAVADQSIDLPEADAVIQIGVTSGSRMQVSKSERSVLTITGRTTYWKDSKASRRED